jgi:hypothetical protein
MPNNVTVFWPGQPDPTRGVHNHRQESIEFFTIFPDNQLVNNPYKILFQKMITLAQQQILLVRSKASVAYWKDRKILEERLFYDQVRMLK